MNTFFRKLLVPVLFASYGGSFSKRCLPKESAEWFYELKSRSNDEKFLTPHYGGMEVKHEKK